ncbi:MAG TPA: GTP cyclohydrolase I FolE [Elusimicrobiota bacterium]|nr:GTP cyclohydrolase I FolE [Elusimicrobiota bacterium]
MKNTVSAASARGADTTELSDLVRGVLRQLGEDPQREGLLKTPERVARSLRELTSGYHIDIDRLINDALFEVPYSEMVIVKDIDFYSLCEHHLLPFFGRCHVAYVPDGRVVGLSKIPRVVEAYCRRLQVQERLTSQIANIIVRKVKPLGVAVVMEARHLCMEMRGAQSKNSPTVTSAMLGVFRKDPRTREEFLGIVRGSRRT